LITEPAHQLASARKFPRAFVPATDYHITYINICGDVLHIPAKRIIPESRLQIMSQNECLYALRTKNGEIAKANEPDFRSAVGGGLVVASDQWPVKAKRGRCRRERCCEWPVTSGL